MNKIKWKIGELAERCGLSVRALRHYDEIGLLCPERATMSGYRLYGETEVRRLYEIQALKSLGLSLDEIGEWLDGGEHSHLETLERQLQRLESVKQDAEALQGRIRGLISQIEAGRQTGVNDLVETMEMMTMFEKYYTKEQLDQLAERREVVGEERIQEVEAEWPRLMAEVGREMEKGTPPTDPKVQELARRWNALIEEFTGGDPGIRNSLGQMYASEENVAGMDVGPIREMGEYLGKARAE